MSLNRAEQAITSRELRANLITAGLSQEDVAADLGWAAKRFDSTVAVDAASVPEDVWELRDYLEQTIDDLGCTGTPFTVLTEHARGRAAMWFLLRQPPRHAFVS